MQQRCGQLNEVRVSLVAGKAARQAQQAAFGQLGKFTVSLLIPAWLGLVTVGENLVADTAALEKSSYMTANAFADSNASTTEINTNFLI